MANDRICKQETEVGQRVSIIGSHLDRKEKRKSSYAAKIIINSYFPDSLSFQPFEYIPAAIW